MLIELGVLNSLSLLRHIGGHEIEAEGGSGRFMNFFQGKNSPVI